MFERFFYNSSMPPGDLHATYNLILLSLSYLVAAFSSFVALYIGKNIRQNGKRNYWWLLAGAFTLGVGIWTVNFISLQAIILPFSISYDPLLAILSLISVIIAAAITFYIISKKECNLSSIAVGGIFAGIGICAMHYLAKMAMLGLNILISPSYFFFYILSTIVGTQVAMWLMVNIERVPQIVREYVRLSIGLIMGAGVFGIHYIGMASAIYYTDHHTTTISRNAISAELLSVALGVTTILVIGNALLLAVYHAKVTDQERRTRAVLSTIAEGIMQIRTNGIIENCNPAAEKIFGFEQNTLPNKNFYELIKNKSENEGSLQLDQLISSGQKNLEFIGCKKNGEHFPAEISVSKLNVTQGEFFVIVIRDISTRKQNENELLILNQRLVELARKAGMIQVTNSVLHNVGNVLNSINTSASVINEKINESDVTTLTEIAKLIEEHKNHMNDFLTKDEKGKKCLEFIVLLAKVLPQEHVNVMEEVRSLTDKVDHVKHIIQMQQAMEGSNVHLEEGDISALIQDALSINGLNKSSKISIETHFQDIPNLLLNKVKLVQILVNIIQNAKTAVMDNDKDLKMISISAFIENNNLVIDIEDNGTGIEPEIIEKIFTFGFTTKKDGHGFGLHSCLISAQEMGGSLRVQSQGKGTGAKFTLELPYQPAKSFCITSR